MMPSSIKPQLQPSAKHPYFVYDSLGDGFMYFSSESARNDHAKFVISGYLNDGWDEEVTNVVAGELTHTTLMTNKVERPDIIDEDDYDQDGTYWDPCWAYMCDYKLVKLGPQAANDNQPREGMCDDPDCVGCDPIPSSSSKA